MPLPKPPPKMLAELEQLASTSPQNTAPAADSAEKCDASQKENIYVGWQIYVVIVACFSISSALYLPLLVTPITCILCLIAVFVEMDRRFARLDQKINEIKERDSLVATDARKQFDSLRKRVAEYRDDLK